MTAHRPFEIAVFTDGSTADPCAGALIGRLCDHLLSRLSIVHAFARPADARDAADRLEHWLPEAERWPGTRRRLVQGRLADAVERIQREHPVDLVVAAATTPSLLGRCRRSHRGDLARSGVAAMLSLGPRVSTMTDVPRRVACVRHVGATGEVEFRRAAELASVLDAPLDVVHVLPEVHEGSLARLAYAPPIDATVARAALRRVPGAGDVSLAVHVTRERDLALTLETLGAELVVVDDRAWRGSLLGHLPTALDHLSAPVLCVNAAMTAAWSHLTRRPQPSRRPTLVVAQGRRLEGAEQFASLAS